MSGYFFDGSKSSGLIRTAGSDLPSALVYSMSSALPQLYSACWGLASLTFRAAAKSAPLTQRSGNSSKRCWVKT